MLATTDISGPTPPKILNLSCQANETIHIQIGRPSNFYYSVDYYYVYIKVGGTLYDNITIHTNKDHAETKVRIYLLYQQILFTLFLFVFSFLGKT